MSRTSRIEVHLTPKLRADRGSGPGVQCVQLAGFHVSRHNPPAMRELTRQATLTETRNGRRPVARQAGCLAWMPGESEVSYWAEP